MYSPTFFDYFQRNIIIASQGESDYVLIDGVLKKGTWKTMPNHVHVFIVGGIIHAGPPDIIGKKPDELGEPDWDNIAQNDNPNPNPVRQEVTEKYRMEMMEIRTIKRKDAREAAMDKVMHKMAAEDEFHVIFLNTKGKPSPELHSLTKAFADYGQFPIHGSFHDQVTFYKDRVSLLHQLAQSLPPDAKKDVKPHVEHISELVDSLLEHGPEHHKDTKTTPQEEPTKTTTEHYNPKTDLFEEDEPFNASEAPTAPFPKVEVHNPGPSSGNNQPPPQPKQKVVTPNSSGNGQSQRAPNNSNPVRRPTPVIRPRQQHITPVPAQKAGRAKSRIMLSIESLLRGTFGFIVATIAWWIAKGLKKSESVDNKMLYSLTKYILSNTNINERDNFFNVFTKSFGI